MNRLRFSFLFAVLLFAASSLVVVEPSRAEESNLILEGTFKATWTTHATESQLYSRSLENVKKVCFYDNYVLLIQASGEGKLLAVDRLIDFTWAPMDGAASADAAAPQSPTVNANYLNYARAMVKKYDTNSDGALEKDEWSKMTRDPSAADKNEDGKITPEEYARHLMNR